MKPVIIICSRLGGRRLPDKALMKLAGLTTLDHILERVTRRGVKTVLAVPNCQGTRFFSEFGLTRGKLRDYDADYFIGDDDSPLHRMAEYVLEHPEHDWVIRITHDDPIIDWPTVESLLEAAAKAPPDVGYLWTPGIVEGAGVELIHVDNLLAAASRRKEPTEFVSYFVSGPGLPRPAKLAVKPRSEVCRSYRLTLDYPEDATLLQLVLGAMGPGEGTADICRYLDRNHALLNINLLPLITYYTCAFNASKWIEETIRSVISHRYYNFEYIVVDDSSTDDTAVKVAGFLTDKRVRLVTNSRNVGLAASSNVALGHARGKYVMRVDADDRLIPHYANDLLTWDIETSVSQSDVVYSAYSTIDEKGNIVQEWSDPSEHHHMGGALVRKRVLDEIRFRDDLRHWDGLDLYERLKARGARIAYSPKVTWHYRVRPGSMSRSEPEARAAVRAEIAGGGTTT